MPNALAKLHPEKPIFLNPKDRKAIARSVAADLRRSYGQRVLVNPYPARGD